MHDEVADRICILLERFMQRGHFHEIGPGSDYADDGFQG
jgi:hypothetical protein